jgi:hypothetical protein
MRRIKTIQCTQLTSKKKKSKPVSRLPSDPEPPRSDPRFRSDPGPTPPGISLPNDSGRVLLLRTSVKAGGPLSPGFNSNGCGLKLGRELLLLIVLILERREREAFGGVIGGRFSTGLINFPGKFCELP